MENGSENMVTDERTVPGMMCSILPRKLYSTEENRNFLRYQLKKYIRCFTPSGDILFEYHGAFKHGQFS
ncbi:hypothetical protein AHAS_Ahas17G0072300 [Arachis hypogaea]